MNEAKGEEAAIISKAEGEKKQLKAARGDVVVFNQLYNQYKTNPEITRERLDTRNIRASSSRCGDVYHE